MLVDDLDLSLIVTLTDGYRDVQYMGLAGGLNGYFCVGQIIAKLLPGVRTGKSEDDQTSGLVTGKYTDCGSSFNAFAAVGIRYDDALDIFDDVAAGSNRDLIRQCAESRPGFGCAVGNGNRLGTAHGWHQFPPQDIDIGLVSMTILIHDVFLISYKRCLLKVVLLYRRLLVVTIFT